MEGLFLALMVYLKVWPNLITYGLKLEVKHMACWIVMHVCFVVLLRTLLHVVWIGGP